MTSTIIQQALILGKRATKESYTNAKYIKKEPKTYYIDKYWVKHPELRKNYVLGKMQIYDSQKNRYIFQPQELSTKIPKLDS